MFYEFDSNTFLQVTAVRPIADERWSVEYMQERDKNGAEATFDFLVIASGFFGQPTIPTMSLTKSTADGTQKKRAPKILHSAAYEGREQFRDRTIVVVGGSVSAVEICGDAAIVAAEVHHVVPRSFYVNPRHQPQKPDVDGSPFLPLDVLAYQRAPRDALSSSSRSHDDAFGAIRRENWPKLNETQAKSCGGDLRDLEPFMANRNCEPIFLAIDDHYSHLTRAGFIQLHHGYVTSVDGDSIKFRSDGKEK